MIPIRLPGFGPKRPRYPVAPKEERTVDGRVFASKKEAARYAGLLLEVRAGLIRDLELQPKFEVFINGKKLCHYTADFRFSRCGTGETVILEVKSSGSRKEASYKLRRRAAELAHGITVTEES